MSRFKNYHPSIALGGFFFRSIGVTRTHGMAAPPRSPSLLESDTRLAADVPQIVGSTVTTSRVCVLLKAADRVPTSVQKGEMRDATLFLTFDKARAWAVMDAVAALWLVRWGRTEDNGYILMTSADEIRSSFTPSNKYKRRRNEAGMKFLMDLDRLPPGVRADLRAGKRVSVSDLPPQMQAHLSEMVEALNQERVAKSPDNDPFPLSLVPQSTLTFSMKDYGEVQDYWVKVSNSMWGETGFAFDNYEYNRRPRPGVGSSGSATTAREGSGDAKATREYSPIKFEITQKQARTLPELRKSIRIERRRATLPQILREMYDRYDTSIVADPPAVQKQICDVSFDAASLPEAFDRLTQIYRDTQWEYRPSGFFVIRSGPNPARAR